MLKRNSFHTYFSIVLMFATILNCEESKYDPITEGPSIEIVAKVFPDIGTNVTRFQPDVYVVSDSDTVFVGENLLIRCDYNGDGQPDTDWLDTIPRTDVFDSHGKHTFNFEVKDTLGNNSSYRHDHG